MKCAILLAAYGVSTLQSDSALKRFDALVRARFPHMPVRWAFTSCMVRQRMAEARKKSDSIQKALEKYRFEKFTHIAVQPLQTIPGRENSDVGLAVQEASRDNAMVICTGRPLLATTADVHAAALALVQHVPAERKAHEDVVFMGHGAQHAAVSRYENLAQQVRALDSHVHVGAMNGITTLDAILPTLSSKRVWLMPLLSVVGRHALNDMAGEAPCSWKQRIAAAGHECIPVLKGIAEYQAVAEIWIEHLAQAVAALHLAQPCPDEMK
jgi:sirohydrochlorin cobaltochelatase